MYDIVKFESKHLCVYNKIEESIIRCKDIKEARNHWNKEKLVLLDDYSFDSGLMSEIGAKAKLCFLIDLSRIIKTSGIIRAIGLTKIRNFLRFCNKFGIFYTFATFEERAEDIRSEEEIINIGLLFDINRGQAKFAVKMLEQYLKKK